MLNERAAKLCDRLADDAHRLGIAVSRNAIGTRLFDCGIAVPGSLEAGRRLAEICLAGLAEVSVLTDSASAALPGLTTVEVHSTAPVAACMASQYAGWKIAQGDYFAIGSGPMRAAAGSEALYERIGFRESPAMAVGVLETRQFPPDPLQHELAHQCGVEPAQLTLLAAPTASAAGTLQVVARSLETALHKLVELDFDVRRVRAGWGRAPLPPVADDDLAAIGRTNDAILYGGEVQLDVEADDEELESIGPRVPSNSSPDHGHNFATLFARYDHDFYRLDPHLFSPAVITLVSLTSGRSFRFGEFQAELVRQSFGG